MIFIIQCGEPGNVANKNDSNGNAVAVTDFGKRTLDERLCSGNFPKVDLIFSITRWSHGSMGLVLCIRPGRDIFNPKPAKLFADISR